MSAINFWLEQCLELWTNDVDFIIAPTEERVLEIMCDQYGGEPDDWDDEVEWRTMDPNDLFALRLDTGTTRTQSVRCWIEEYGECYFACTEF